MFKVGHAGDVYTKGFLAIGDDPGTTSKRNLLIYENAANAELIQFCNSATGFASSSDGFVTGITSAGVGYIWHYDNLGITFGTNNTSAGQITAGGYWQLGSGAPNIKMKKLTGTTASTEGGSTTVAHGLTASKIISARLHIYGVTIGNVTDGFTVFDGYLANIYHDNTNFAVANHATNSENILSKSFSITIFYEE